jgi:hypothetical protein
MAMAAVVVSVISPPQSRKFGKGHLGKAGRTLQALKETGFFQNVIRLNDFPQAVFGRPVTAIGIRMVQFNKLLIARFDFGATGCVRQIEHIQGTFFKR